MAAPNHEAQIQTWVCEVTGTTHTVVLYSDDEAKHHTLTKEGKEHTSYYDRESCMIPHIKNLFRLMDRKNGSQ